jgi:hypothetical protein
LSSLADALKSPRALAPDQPFVPEHMIEHAAGFPCRMHLKLGINDIVDPWRAPPACPPACRRASAIFRGWDAKQPC